MVSGQWTVWSVLIRNSEFGIKLAVASVECEELRVEFFNLEFGMRNAE